MNSHRGPLVLRKILQARAGDPQHYRRVSCPWNPMLRRYCGGDTAIADSGQDQERLRLRNIDHGLESRPEKHQPLITHKINSRPKLIKILRFSPVSITISPSLPPQVKICVISPAATLICISSRRSAGRKVEMPSPVGLCPSKSSYSRPVQSEPAPTPEP